MPAIRLAAALVSLALLGAGPARAAHAQTPAAVLRGVVYDSLAGAPLAGAVVQAAPAADVSQTRAVTTDSLGRFRIDSLAAGRWIVGFDHPTLEPLSLEMPIRAVTLSAGDTADVALVLPGPRALHGVVCAAQVGDSTGAVVGTVRGAESSAPVDGAKAFVAWPEIEIGRGRIERVVRRVAVPIRLGGSFLLCGVPSDVELVLRVEAPGLTSGDVVLTVKPGALAWQDLTVGTAVAAGAVTAPAPADSTAVLGAPLPVRGGARLAGTVRDERGRPIANARVLVLGVEGRSTRVSDAGTFVIDSLPSGTWTAEARAIGYQPTRVAVQLSTRRDADARVVMPKVAVALQQVVVYGKGGISQATRAVSEALDRAKRYGGMLITPEQIERQHPLWPSDLLRTVPGMRVEGSGISRTIIGRGGCQPAVYLDGMPIQDGASDLDQIVSAPEVMAVEVYRGLTVPAQYGGTMGGGCGSVIVWTKR